MTEKFIEQQTDEELMVGNWKPGRYAWELKDVRTVENFPVKGRQGIFYLEVDNELITPSTKLIG